jgi:adenosylhomocysteine nucleosidase
MFYSGTHVLGGRSYRFTALQAVDPGQASMSLAYQLLIRTAQPRLTVLLGIAGGLSDKVALGDVVLANHVIDYDPGTDTPAGLSRRSVGYNIPLVVKNAFNNLFVNVGEPATLPSPGGGTFRLFRGPLGTGSDVVKAKGSDIREVLLRFNIKTIAVETEAGAVARGFYEDDEITKLGPYVVLRGISDYADEDKDDSDQTRASENAVAALRVLLEWVGEVLVASSKKGRSE